MRKPARGFTLLELMIVVAIIGILAAVALPAYQNFSVRAKVSEALLALGACRAAISEVYQSGGTSPGPDNWGCEQDGSRFVEAISTDVDGVVTVTLAGIGSAVDGKTITLAPRIDGAPADAASHMGRSVGAWICGGSGTDLATNYLPASCRGT
jgi:type IV pilus assembly protein PilA